METLIKLMKPTTKSTTLVTLLSVLALSASASFAATLDIRFAPTDAQSPDAMYPLDSTVTTGTSATAGLIATLAGRNYGVEPAGTSRYGIAASPPLTPASAAVWTVRSGFAPVAVGSTQNSTAQTGASYMSVVLSGAAAGTVFKNVALTFAGIVTTTNTNAWAGTSANNFATSTALTFSRVNTVRQLAVTLPEFTTPTSDPLEIRLYGILGGDTGTFKSVSVTGETIAPSPVPEPDATLLITSVALGAAVSFRRRRNAVPR